MTRLLLRLRITLHGCPVCGRWFLLRHGRHLEFCRYGIALQ